ncbi:MAG: DEAD/DEAH box helicase [Solirubrobacteraceae bacterium MAG38_C4-C5]|nr:DEAD/DEAH box helicase [Candidatus Siliceabacter maunaloa]
MPSPTFAELGVSQAALRALDQRGITAPFAIQSLVIPDVLAGRDVLAKSPTGSGKTLAFGVPIADRIEATDPRPSALILAPTRELATQIVEAIRDVAHARALSVTAVYGGAGIEKQARQAPKSHILVATPGRLEDLIQRGAVRLDRVRLLVLDEADRMLDMGFRPVVERIVKQTRRDRQTLLFSATLDGEVGRLAAAYTRDPRTHEHVPAPEALGKVAHRFVRLAHDDKLDALVRELRDDARGRTLVFVRTKRGADRLVKRLDRHNLHALAMHGDKSQNQRERALGRFDRGDIDTLVATDVAARGIDVDDITHVVNFDAPEDREGYVHRVGRTARAGRTGTGVTFVMDDQARDMGKIAVELELLREFTSAGFATPTASSHSNGNGRSGGQGRSGGPGRSGGQRRRHPRSRPAARA